MALSKKSTLILINAMADKAAANALIANLNAATAPSEKTAKVLAVAMASQYKSKSKKKSAVDEVLAAIVSGAALSLNAKRAIVIMMADAAAGNELINLIQLVDTAPIKL